MSKLWRLIVICSLVLLSFNHSPIAYSATSTDQPDQANTPVETHLFRKIVPNKLPVDKGNILMTQTYPEDKSSSTNSLKSLPKLGADTNFYGVLGILLLTLVKVMQRYFRIKEG